MITATLRERAARANYEAQRPALAPAWDDIPDHLRESWLIRTDAVLAVLPDPSPVTTPLTMTVGARVVEAVLVPREVVTYAATALEGSDDRGDLWCASQLRQHAGERTA